MAKRMRNCKKWNALPICTLLKYSRGIKYKHLMDSKGTCRLQKHMIRTSLLFTLSKPSGINCISSHLVRCYYIMRPSWNSSGHHLSPNKLGNMSYHQKCNVRHFEQMLLRKRHNTLSFFQFHKTGSSILLQHNCWLIFLAFSNPLISVTLLRIRSPQAPFKGSAPKYQREFSILSILISRIICVDYCYR